MSALRLVALALLLVGASFAHADRIVRGGGGQPNLRLDYGRSLVRLERGGPRLRSTLSAIERVRLEARRLFSASLRARDAVSLLVDLVRVHLPSSPDELYDHFNATLPSDEAVPLSAYVQRRVGICRERAFLLGKLLRDSGLDAQVKYGVIYDRRGDEISGHAWVETKLDGRRARIDPSVDHPISVRIRQRPVTQITEDGQTRTVLASRSWSWLYVPEAIDYLE